MGEIVVEKIDGNSGDQYAFEDVLMIGDGDKVTVGTPGLKGAAVVAEVVEQGKGDKVIIFKKRQRSTYKRKNGHRQLQTTVKITEIVAKGFDASSLKKASAKKAEPAAEEAPKAKKAAPKKAEAAPEVKEEAPKAKKAAPKTEEAKAEAKPAAEKKAPAKKAAAKADDLTQLKGVGPAYAKKLNEAGITSFAQLAELTPEGVTELEEKLNAAGRVERDGWIEQAKELAK